MRQQLRKLRLPLLGLAIVAAALGCASQPYGRGGRSELDTLQTVNMVRAGDFGRLDRYYSAVQSSYDAGRISDKALRSAFRHFYDTAPDLGTQYASWVKKMPNSYVAHLARAIYYVRTGKRSRGNKFISETGEAQLNGMDEAFAVAMEELQKSASLERKPLLTVFYELDIGLYYGDAAQNRRLLQQSLAIDRNNFIAREMYMLTLQTAWGGSTAQMKGFLATCEAAGLPAADITELTSLIVANEAWIDDLHGNFKRAGQEYLEAERLSPGGICLLCAGSDFMSARDYPDAVQALSGYLARNPDSAEALSLRAFAYFALNRTPEGMSDCGHAAALGNSSCQYMLGWAYSIGAYGVSMNRTTSIKWLTLAAKQGNKDAEKLLPLVRNGQMWTLAQPQPHPH